MKTKKTIKIEKQKKNSRKANNNKKTQIKTENKTDRNEKKIRQKTEKQTHRADKKSHEWKIHIYTASRAAQQQQQQQHTHRIAKSAEARSIAVQHKNRTASMRGVYVCNIYREKRLHHNQNTHTYI